MGICVDHRRRNKSLESLELNVQRLKTYKDKLVVFPRHAAKPKQGDASAAECAAAVQLKGAVLPIVQTCPKEAPRAVTPQEAAQEAYMRIQTTRLTQRYAGMREKRAKLLEEADAIKKK